MKTLAVLALLAAIPAGAAVADDHGRDHDDDCLVPMADWQPREAVERLAAANGWAVRRIKVDDGCYEIVGTDADGRGIEAKVDPATLAVIEIEHEDDDEDDDHRGRDDRGAGRAPAAPGPAAPPRNQLLGTGAPPQARVN